MSFPRAIALLCTLLLCTSGVTAFVPVDAGPSAATLGGPSASAAVTTPGYLPVTAERRGFASVDVSVTDSLATSRATLDQRLTRATLQQRLDDAENDTERRRIVSNATTVLETRTNALVADAADARERFRRGSLSAANYSTTLASIDARAESLISLAQFIEARPAASATSKTRAAQLRAQLLAYSDSLRDRIAAATDGESRLDRLYVEAGPNGTALAAVEDESYVRTASRPTNYDTDPAGVPSGSAIIDHVESLYPWVMNQSTGVSFVPIPIQSSSAKYAYRLSLTYSNGTVESYVDMSSGEVYQETETLALDGLAASPDASTTSGDTRLTVSRAYSGGPMRVSVTADGSPTSATVSIGNETVGSTGADGRLWTPSPSDSVTVSARTATGETLRVQSTSLPAA
ncbi:hypothetical protein J2754_001448 [Halarchaeum solikamskense]|uniref:DUF7094 domain-containing protein n=1 Tax=Halarchaeum nitratireducens TaxID=489913 RepID=UPI001B3B1469|nr:hypothetical protein [Halarchaeum solikamskense]MBP2251127.1 hypothetical protein [Halarchaeum solikamskense]